MNLICSNAGLQANIFANTFKESLSEMMLDSWNILKKDKETIPEKALLSTAVASWSTSVEATK